MDLLQIRRHKQTAVTVLMSSVERFIVAEDQEKVQRQLDKLHGAFDLFETAHLEVLASLNADPDGQSTESLKFVDIERLYTLSVKTAKAFLNRDIPVNDPATTICQLMNVPNVELKVFSGDSCEYLSFMSIFNETVDKAPLSGQAKLTRLLGYTRDKARVAIDHCSLIGGDSGYEEAKKILQERFGDEYIIATNLILTLQTGKNVYSAEDLRLLSDQLHNASLMMKHKNTYSELDNHHNIKKICSRLSGNLNAMWRDRVFSIKRKHGRYPNFDEFVTFMKEKSDEANDPIYGQSSASKQMDSNNRPAASSMNCVTTSRLSTKCVVCDENHQLFKCVQFKSLDHDDRQSVVDRNNLCVNCLRSSHSVSQCKYKQFCNVSDCTTKHNSLLHKFTSAANYSANSKNNVNSVMPIVHVMINNTVKLRCLLDTGSTSSFIAKNVVSKLNLPCSPAYLNLMTLNSSAAEESQVVKFDIESMDHNYSVNMKNIFVVDKIPGKSYKLDVSVYPHLYNIDVVDSFDGNIDLLIGQDYAECFQPLELLRGNKNEPYAVRTPLGIVVHGPSSQHVVSDCVVSNLVSVSTPQSDVNKLCELENLDILQDSQCDLLDEVYPQSVGVLDFNNVPIQLLESKYVLGDTWNPGPQLDYFCVDMVVPFPCVIYRWIIFYFLAVIFDYFGLFYLVSKYLVKQLWSWLGLIELKLLLHSWSDLLLSCINMNVMTINIQDVKSLCLVSVCFTVLPLFVCMLLFGDCDSFVMDSSIMRGMLATEPLYGLFSISIIYRPHCFPYLCQPMHVNSMHRSQDSDVL